MKTAIHVLILAGGMALCGFGCGTMQVTSIFSPDHRRDPDQLVLFRITPLEQPERVHFTGHWSSEQAMADGVLIIATTH